MSGLAIIRARYRSDRFLQGGREETGDRSTSGTKDKKCHKVVTQMLLERPVGEQREQIEGA